MITNFKMNDRMALGVFDADGYVVINIRVSRASSSNIDAQPFGIGIEYGFEQSKSKADLVKKFAAKFDGITKDSSIKSVFRVGANSPTGMNVRSFLLKNNPRHPGKFRDFLLSEEIRILFNQNAQKTKSGLVTLIILAYNNTKNLNENSRKTPLEKWYSIIAANEVDFNLGYSNAQSILDKINNKVAHLEQMLPQTNFSLEYIRGAHFGDGGLTVALTCSLAPRGRRRYEPEWTISGENIHYCQAFVYSFKKGRTNLAGKNYHKFVLTGIDACMSVFYVFENTWMPAYKLEQFSNFKQAVVLLKNKKHFTKKGTIALIDLAYDMSEKGFRQRSKEEYIKEGVQWLINHDYIAS